MEESMIGRNKRVSIKTKARRRPPMPEWCRKPHYMAFVLETRRAGKLHTAK
jgi:hypothetical protein